MRRDASKRIAVIGRAEASAEEQVLAQEVGQLIGARGGMVVCGGLGGVMEAACRGAKQAGGLTVGILPGGDAASANPYVDIPIATGLGDARNVIVVSTAEVVIAIGGGVGTLAEIAFALRRLKPVIGLGTWKLERNRFPSGAQFVEVSTAAEAVDKAWAL